MCPTFEGKAKLFYSETSDIELIALYVHPKNSNHLQYHIQEPVCSRAIMALDHSRLGLENKLSENKSGRISLCSTGLLYKFLPTNLEVCKPTFYTSYTSHLRWNTTICHTDLGQNAIFHNFSRQIARSEYSGNRSKNLQNYPHGQRFSFLVWPVSVVECLNEL